VIAARRERGGRPPLPRFGAVAPASLVPPSAASRRRLLAVGALAVTVCGVVAYTRAGAGPLDALYNTLLLFTATYTAPSSGATHAAPSSGPTPVLLQVARFAALGIAFATVASALVVLFRDHVDALAARRARRHVVLCGLGELGARLALLLRSEGYGVVGVEPYVDQATVRRLRREGVRVIAADPQDPRALKRTGLDQACSLVALDAADDTNAAIVGLATSSREGTAGSRLACLAHVRDLALCERLRSMSLREPDAAASVTVDFVNADENAAQDLLAQQGAWLLQRVPLHLAIVEPSRFGVALILQLARVRTASLGAAQLALSVAGIEAHRWWKETIDTWPELAAIAPVALFDEQPAPPTLSDLASRAQNVTGLPVHFAAVCSPDSKRSLLLALTLADTLAGVQIAVRADGAEGLAPTLAKQAPTLNLVDTAASLLRPDVLLSDVYVMLARAAHENYLARQRSGGAVLFSRPSLRQWDQLSERLKVSNLDQARFMIENLRRSGYDVLRAGTGTQVVDFDAATVDLMAEREHERWVREHRRGHYHRGAMRNDRQRYDPDLVAWDSLPEDRKELDREVVRKYPHQAARAGYGIVPLKRSGRSTALPGGGRIAP
jgi:voltage-gated potassium channel Kch